MQVQPPTGLSNPHGPVLLSGLSFHSPNVRYVYPPAHTSSLEKITALTCLDFLITI